jgi:hypothetical protein
MNMNNNFCMGEGYKKVERVGNSFYHKSEWIEETQPGLRITTCIRRICGIQNLIPIYVSAITGKA